MINIASYNDPLKFPSYGVINTHFGYFFNQLIADSELDDTQKHSCLTTICGIEHVLSPNDFHKECNNIFFYGNKLQGIECRIFDNLNPFVRINDADAFFSWISEITGIAATNTVAKIKEIIYARDETGKKLLLRSFLNNKAVKSSYDTEEHCTKYFGLKSWAAKDPPKLRDAYLTFYKGIQWSFPKPEKEDIFATQATIQQLGCRAGIMDDSRKIILTHNLNMNYNVRKPTTFDAGFYEQFEPGGVTKPMLACDTLEGFNEYVHTPNQFININANIYETF